jgi:hypothetical protein
MTKNLKLSEEQLKTLKLFSYYCASHGAKTAMLTVYLNEGGSVDWQDDVWSSETGTRIESYDKIDNLIDYIFNETDLMDYYEYDNQGSLQFKIDVKERKMTIEGWHREYSTQDSGMQWSDSNDDFGDLKEDFDRFFEQMDGENGKIGFDGGGDSGYLDDNIELSNGQSMDIPSFIESWCYDMLGSNYGGWEINEGSQGSFNINPSNKLIELYFEENIEEEDSDGTVGYVEF